MREVFEGTGIELTFDRGRITFRPHAAQEAVDVHLDEFGPLVAARAVLEPQGRWQALADEVSGLLPGAGRRPTARSPSSATT